MKLNDITYNFINYLYRIYRLCKGFISAYPIHLPERKSKGWDLQETAMNYLKSYISGQKTDSPELNLLRKLYGERK